MALEEAMAKKNLVIVESPSKAKTIGRYLGPDYTVKASMGHLRDLPKSTMGVDLEGNFEPHYIPVRGKEELIRELKKESGKADIAASGITVTEERKKQVNFTIPYVVAEQLIIVSKKSFVRELDDLKKARIGVQHGTTGDLYTSRNIKEPERFANAPVAVAALLAGKIDAVVVDAEPAQVFVSQRQELILLPKPLTYEEYAFAISKKNPGLLKQFNEELAKKYGVKKQMISGVHFNFSFSDNFLRKLHYLEDPELPFQEFKNKVYLKIARNYLRYCWLIIYLTGCSIGSHKTFSNEFIHMMDAKDEYGSYYSTRGPSFRNASCGYKNLKDLYPSYESVEDFTNDIQKFIDDGDLSEAKELYTQIRLKPKNPKDMLNSLNQDGIEYIEIRTLDINPFYKCGLVLHDMTFLHLFLIYGTADCGTLICSDISFPYVPS